ncbi:MAG TPA: thioredoxin family protein [Dehalococcoidia bacterium]|jgi:thiol-disulfide isomerase/thioredoxin|nr:thioredoxin family protein [Dehalococcoidia bacterium]
MTQQKESVVTPERFESGITYEQYRERIQRNREKFDYNYRETVLTEDDVAAFRRLAEKEGGPAKVLVLGEDWCPDVFRGMPVLARIAEAAGIEMRVFPRDDNLDIMSEFLNHGEHQSIPAVVFYTRDNGYIAHWIERPAKANAEMAEVMKRYEGLDRSKPDDVAKLRQIADEFQTGPIWANWREETIRELRSLLEEKCG